MQSGLCPHSPTPTGWMKARKQLGEPPGSEAGVWGLTLTSCSHWVVRSWLWGAGAGSASSCSGCWLVRAQRAIKVFSPRDLNPNWVYPRTMRSRDSPSKGLRGEQVVTSFPSGRRTSRGTEEELPRAWARDC